MVLQWSLAKRSRQTRAWILTMSYLLPRPFGFEMSLKLFHIRSQSVKLQRLEFWLHCSWNIRPFAQYLHLNSYPALEWSRYSLRYYSSFKSRFTSPRNHETAISISTTRAKLNSPIRSTQHVILQWKQLPCFLGEEYTSRPLLTWSWAVPCFISITVPCAFAVRD